MKIRLLILSILAFHIQLFAQDNYAVIISEQTTFDDAQEIDNQLDKNI
jgi:hypothetical protein